MFPQLLPVARDDALTTSQRTWLQSQLLLDDGAEACPQCEHVGMGAYCQHCGAARAQAGTMQACPQCHMQGPGPYCVQCGAALLHELEEEIMRGDFDWDQWSQNLQPHLGGLTERERAALQRQGAILG